MDELLQLNKCIILIYCSAIIEANLYNLAGFISRDGIIHLHRFNITDYITFFDRITNFDGCFICALCSVIISF